MGTPATQEGAWADEIICSEDQADDCWAMLKDLASGEIIRITKDEFSIGRGEDNDLSLKHQAVSGRHCVIKREDDGHADSEPIVFLYDYSTNGTYINSKTPIGKTKRHLLSTGTEFSVIPPGHGRAKIAFQFELGKQFKAEGPRGELAELYDIRRKLGAGAFAEVHLVVHRKTGETFALKQIDKKKFALSASLRKNALFDEVVILKQLNHKNIIRLHEVFDDREHLNLILEYVSGGELFDRIVTSTRLSEPRARYITLQVLDAIEYLHGQGIAHRDLKPENILMARTDSDDIKVSDFGLSRIVGDESFIKTVCGTPQYLAPEQCDGKGYHKEVDFWAVGVILYVLLSGSPPFHDQKKIPVLDQVRQGRYTFPKTLFGDVSETAVDLIRKLLVVDPKKRIDAARMRGHPWMLGYATMREFWDSRPSLDSTLSSLSPADSQASTVATAAGASSAGAASAGSSSSSIASVSEQDRTVELVGDLGGEREGGPDQPPAGGAAAAAAAAPSRKAGPKSARTTEAGGRKLTGEKRKPASKVPADAADEPDSKRPRTSGGNMSTGLSSVFETLNTGKERRRSARQGGAGPPPADRAA